MTRKVITTVEMEDDIDGSPASQTVLFTWGGKDLQVDLSEEHYQELDQFMSRFAKHARKPDDAGKGKSGQSRPGAGREKSRQIREWAKSEGMSVNARGRISATVIAAYDAAHATAKPAKSGRAKAGAGSPATASSEPSEGGVAPAA